ncbi:MAG: DMT family transporter [Pseudomonadales bacterium]|nr:DMT family transporter [Pseudomonadales bacterium]
MKLFYNRCKQHIDLHPDRWGMIFGASAVLIWGAYLALSRYALTVSTLEPLDITFIRGSVAGFIMLLWLVFSPYKHGRAIRQVGLKKALVLASLVGPPFVFISVKGYAFAPLVHGGVFLPAGLVLAGLTLSALILGDKPGTNKVIAALIILLGLVILAGPDFFQGGTAALRGDGLFFLAGVMWATFAVVQKSWNISPVVATACVSIASVCIYSPVYLFYFGWSRLQDVASSQLLTQAIVQGFLTGVVAMICFGTAVKMIGAARTSMFPALVPITTLLIGIPLTAEWPTLLQCCGTAVVLSGLFYGLRVKIKRGENQPTDKEDSTSLSVGSLQ